MLRYVCDGDHGVVSVVIGVVIGVVVGVVVVVVVVVVMIVVVVVVVAVDVLSPSKEVFFLNVNKHESEG